MKTSLGEIAKSLRDASYADDQELSSYADQIDALPPPAAGPWIPVTDRLPDAMGWVLARQSSGQAWVVGHVDGCWYDVNDDEVYDISHWAELRETVK